MRRTHDTFADKAARFAYAMTIQDPIECTQGHVNGCAWTAIGIIPFGKVGKIGKLAIVGAAAEGAVSRILIQTPRQLQSKFSHAVDFGVEGNYNRAAAAEFSGAINRHVNAPGTRIIEGSYRGDPVTHYVDPSTGLNAMADPAGQFVSGWRLNPEQLENVLTRGSL